MFQIKYRKKRLTMKQRSLKETSDLIILINTFIRRYTGLLSYTTSRKVHWGSNITTLCFIIACILQIITVFMAKDDPDKLFECFSVLTFCGMGVYKLISLRINHSRWCFLLDQVSILEAEELNHLFISDAEYQSDDEDSYNFSTHINNYKEKFKSTSSILRNIYLFTAFIFVISPFSEYILWRALGLEYVKYPHILPGWTPLDNYSIFGYFLTVLCELLAAVYCVCIHVGFDLTVVGIMIFICGQYSLLHDYCARIGGSGKLCITSKKNDKRASFRIRNCHYINMILINSITELDKLLKNIIGVYFFLATLTLCFVAVRLKSSEDMTIMQLVSLLQYMCGTLTQLFLFCQYGDDVLHKSSISMGEGPFSTAYWCLSPRIRRELVLLSIGMTSPRHLWAGPFNYIDFPSFILVVRTAYSYYAVLAQKKH